MRSFRPFHCDNAGARRRIVENRRTPARVPLANQRTGRCSERFQPLRTIGTASGASTVGISHQVRGCGLCGRAKRMRGLGSPHRRFVGASKFLTHLALPVATALELASDGIGLHYRSFLCCVVFRLGPRHPCSGVCGWLPAMTLDVFSCAPAQAHRTAGRPATSSPLLHRLIVVDLWRLTEASGARWPLRRRRLRLVRRVPRCSKLRLDSPRARVRTPSGPTYRPSRHCHGLQAWGAARGVAAALLRPSS